MPMVSVGQFTMHTWHPLHRSTSTTMAPLIFAMPYFLGFIQK
jgi:hypothetical protein